MDVPGVNDTLATFGLSVNPDWLALLHAFTNALASTVPRPVASSYPVPAVNPFTPGTLLFPFVTS